MNYINGEEGLSATNSIDFRKTFANSLTEYSSCDQGEEVASSPGHSQILSRSRGEKSGEGLVPILRHGPEMEASEEVGTDATIFFYLTMSQ